MISIVKTYQDGVSRELALEAVEEGAWISMVSPSRGEMESVGSATGVPFDVLAAALDPEETSRIEVDEGYILVVINVPKAEGSYKFDAIPMAIVITKTTVITVCLEENHILPSNPGVMGGFCTFKRTRFLFLVLFRVATFFLKYLGQIDRRSNAVENSLRKSMKNEDLFQLLDLSKSLTYFTSALRTNRSVVDKLIRLCSNSQIHELIKVREEDEELLEDVKIEYDQAYEMVQMYSNILGGTTDVFASIISNNLNIIMKFLAVVTIVLSIPTMVSSFWGMNVPVPFTMHPAGFWIVMSIALMAAVISVLYLVKKKMF